MLVSINVKTLSNKGYTIPELMVSITLISLISVGLFTIIFNYFANITRSNAFAEMTLDSQNLLRATVEELRYGSGVQQTNTINDPSVTGTGGEWNTSNSNFVIIIAVPAIDSDRNYITDPSTGNPYNNELVYFKQNNFLYARTLANPVATGNRLTTSCPAAIASPTCPADRQLIEYIDNMVFTLYDQDDAVTTDTALARSVKIDLSMQRRTFGDPLVLNNSIRVTLRNTF